MSGRTAEGTADGVEQHVDERQRADGTAWPGAWVTRELGVGLTGEAHELRGLLGLAVRDNPRRAHLLVSRVLGKHVPQDPRVVHDAGTGLGRRVRALLGEEAPGAVVLGYAETATGLGHCVAEGLGGVPYLHSTRREVRSVATAGAFEESHSHATGHLLLPEDPELLAGDGPLVLVDDEFSTGNTVRNTLRGLHRSHPRQRYVVVALVDMRSPADRARLEKCAAELGARIDVVALASGGVRLPEDVLERGRALVRRHEPAARAAESAGAAGTAAECAGGQDAPGQEPAVDDAAGTGALGTDPDRDAAAVQPAETHTPPDARPARAPHRIALPWPAGLPDGGRHGFTPGHQARLDAALPELAGRLAAALREAGALPGAALRDGPPPPGGAPAPTPRLLVLGCEELMYVPLRLARALQEQLGDTAQVRFSTTTRSPVLPVDDPGYAIRTRLTFPAHDDPADGPGPRYAYNVAPGTDPDRRFDAVLVVADSAADTPALHAPGGLLDRLAPHTGAVLLATVPSHVPLPRPLRGPAFSSYGPDEVGWLLQDLSDVHLEAPTEEREEAIQRGGAHYAESLPVEYQPDAAYQRLFHSALDASAVRLARAVGTVTETVLAERGHGVVLASLARAGTPVGVLMRRWARHLHGLDLPHYTLSIVRGRGIDTTALRYLAAHHDPAGVVFVDGWTGKGAITRELAEALAPWPAFHPEIAVLADPGGCVRTYGTREDFLIPSACLNSTVSGLVSRTVLRADLVGPHDFHGAKCYRELAAADLSAHFLDTVTARFDEVRAEAAAEATVLLSADRTPTWDGWRAVERISEEYGIGDVNLVKPGVGETTRVMLRRVPWRVLARRDAGPELDHVRLLAEQRGVPVEETDDLPYRCVGLIHPRYTRGATGADGKAAR
ncbi:phosphoribosyltransferase [Streptomyces sp. JJ36]|uniref:phosphoribosyltransferase n=1 Tax=Streptomyces sp. JJ36 TaxID=2736645 RepID=UPI001F34EEED|nr:phosphoribosyltransferase [Streptomyces sp. JJ36]MCF6524731.1 phosphoribosyltransferase domain-containing protein [Streptomyces sp. JJ36]